MKNWIGDPSFRGPLLCVLSISLLCCSSLMAEERREPTVGAAGFIEQIILPGSELAGIPIEKKTAVVVRVVEAFRHGDSFRYDIEFRGLEPGKYDLGDFLVRKDGTETGRLPEIPVEIKSLLEPGQVEPNPLQKGWLPRLGGYTLVAALATILWIAGLLALIFAGRKKQVVAAAEKPPETLADLLRPRLQDAADNKLNASQYAELERMLFAYWRKRLHCESETPESALTKIHGDSDAGPLMKQLEDWMHRPDRDPTVDLSQLLEPYKKLPVESLAELQS